MKILTDSKPHPETTDMSKKYLHKDTNKQMAKAHQKIEKSNTHDKYFELLIQNLPGVFYIFDEDLAFHKWNRNMEILTGLSSEEFKEANVLDLFHIEYHKQLKEDITDMFKGVSTSTEALITTADNRKVPFYFTGTKATLGNKNFVIGMGLDISKLKQAESARRDSEELYRILAERMSEGLIIFQDFEITYANNAVASILGYEDSSLLIKKNVMDMVAEGFENYFSDMYEVVQYEISTERTFQARWITRNNNEIWVEGRAVCIRWKEQKAVLLTIRDITETKLHEINMAKEALLLRQENVNLRSSIKGLYRLGEVIGKSESIQKVYEEIINAAASDANVVIYGESGTGKELVAREIHNLSRRANKNFVPVNSSAIPTALLESEFFGYQKGAFTGANSDKQGYLDLANHGSLFLDEIGDLELLLQAKFLRALEAGGYHPVGSTMVKHSDCRIICATHKNLVQQVKKGEMREDFFYRIHIIPLVLPPLRERKEDIPLLVEHFLSKFSNKTKIQALPGNVMKTLMQYDFPGNIRELQNVLQRYLATKSINFLFEDDLSPARPTEASVKVVNPGLQDELSTLEKEIIDKMMLKHGGNKSSAAKEMGITRKTLARKLKLFEESPA